MDRRNEDLMITYRTAVRWGLYDEAANIQRRMMGSGGSAAILAELRAMEEEKPKQGIFAHIKALFTRAQNSARQA